MKQKTVLAVDLGAESGRVMAVHFDGRTLTLQELHRFRNRPVSAGGTLYWDFLRLWRDVQKGIEKGKTLRPASIGVDTWGVDFALLDRQGGLIANPVCYRDSRTEGVMEEVFQRVPQAEIFAQTGIQFLSINTLYQMVSLVENKSPQLEIAHTFLTAPDLLNYWLTGARVCEFSNATTTQMFNPTGRRWATSLLEKLDIPGHIFPEVVSPGTPLGQYQGIPVIAPACHDTGSAVAAVPARDEHCAYISSGTWSLVGLEIDRPIINKAALAANVTNEGGVYGTFRLLQNVMGLWILQSCRAAWKAAGHAFTYEQLVEMAQAAPPLRALIDPNDQRFLPLGDQPERVRQYLAETGQPVPSEVGGIVRCVLESLALKYQEVLLILKELTGRPVTTLHLVGGGSQNELLNQFTASATGLPVVAGPVEATVLGNALVQLISLGEIADLAQARQIVAGLDGLRRYEPQQPEIWQTAYGRFQAMKPG
jgi:rhamnulokinase